MPLGGGGSGTRGVAVLLRVGATHRDALHALCAGLLRAWDGTAGHRQQQQQAWGAPEFAAFEAALVGAGWAPDRVALAPGDARLAWGGVDAGAESANVHQMSAG